MPGCELKSGYFTGLFIYGLYSNFCRLLYTIGVVLLVKLIERIRLLPKSATNKLPVAVIGFLNSSPIGLLKAARSVSLYPGGPTGLPAMNERMPPAYAGV